MDIKDILSTDNIRDYTNAIPSVPYFFAPLFPDSRVEGFKFKVYRNSSDGLVTAARFHAFDAETDVDTREQLDFMEGTLGFVKRERLISEEDLLILSAPRNNAEAQMAINHIYNDAVAMRQSVESRIEALRAQVIQTGKIEINENGYKNTVDFGMKSTHKATWDWTGGGKSKLDLLTEACDLVEEDSNGYRPTRAYTSRKQLAKMLMDEDLREIILGTNRKKGILTQNDLNTYFAEQGLPQFYVFKKFWKQYDDTKAEGVKKNYLDDDKVILLPDGPVGETIYGTTPEEVNMRSAGTDVSKVGNICMQVKPYNDPEGYFIKASSSVMVTLSRPDHIFVGTVQ